MTAEEVWGEYEARATEWLRAVSEAARAEGLDVGEPDTWEQSAAILLVEPKRKGLAEKHRTVATIALGVRQECRNGGIRFVSRTELDEALFEATESQVAHDEGDLDDIWEQVAPEGEERAVARAVALAMVNRSAEQHASTHRIPEEKLKAARERGQEAGFGRIKR